MNEQIDQQTEEEFQCNPIDILLAEDNDADIKIALRAFKTHAAGSNPKLISRFPDRSFLR